MSWGPQGVGSVGFFISFLLFLLLLLHPFFLQILLVLAFFFYLFTPIAVVIPWSLKWDVSCKIITHARPQAAPQVVCYPSPARGAELSHPDKYSLKAGHSQTDKHSLKAVVERVSLKKRPVQDIRRDILMFLKKKTKKTKKNNL